MRFLYLVHFNAPMGGLHENVYSSALYMKEKGHDVYVVLKKGELQKRLEINDIHTITTDYLNISETLKIIENQNIEFDIVHAHPGVSRKVALHYAGKHKIPLIITFHGMWSDSLHQYIDKVNAVVCVSEGIKDFIKADIPHGNEKIFVMPNGFDSQLFDEATFYNESSKSLNISFITRLDTDKIFILDIFKIALKYLKNNNNYNITFSIIGDGTLKESFLDECNAMLSGSKHKIEFKGWLVDEQLKTAYLNSDIIIAPGRSVIEAMACGKPVIAVGSKKYIGLIKNDNWQAGMYNNFGGFGNKFEDYQKGMIESDLDILLENNNNINLIGKYSYEVANTYFNSNAINESLYNLYKTLFLENNIKLHLKNL